MAPDKRTPSLFLLAVNDPEQGAATDAYPTALAPELKERSQRHGLVGLVKSQSQNQNQLYSLAHNQHQYQPQDQYNVHDHYQNHGQNHDQRNNPIHAQSQHRSQNQNHDQNQHRSQNQMATYLAPPAQNVPYPLKGATDGQELGPGGRDVSIKLLPSEAHQGIQLIHLSPHPRTIDSPTSRRLEGYLSDI
ncbi:hypothetical protein BV20DRAFT_1056551 [Pilatotrama ljubarskyi]|nr:hypothetical protein BV20DRAFT_1056551 [Pilatotrama ljubarskyi]